MSAAARLSLSLFALLVAAALVIVARAHYVADLSAFLPASPSAAQRLLVQQLRDGAASRLVLAGIEGGDAQQRAKASHELAAALRGQPQFVAVNNGEDGSNETDRRFVFEHRYALSDAVTPERFSESGLESAIGDNLEQLTAFAGVPAGQMFQADPTGETLQIVDRLAGARQPPKSAGVWSSKDGRRALLLLQTRASGSDTDAQEQALSAIDIAWRAIAPPSLQLLVSSPGKFAVDARSTIKREATRLSLLSSLLIVALLLWAYRSLPALLLGLLPVACGALAGIAAVQVGFGLVHGITLGFGVTLIGESVDYSVYLLVQARGGRDEASSRALWPTMVLGALTSICGFASLLPSAFPGLAQLGLFSIAGLIAACLVTRFVLPTLLPAQLRMADFNAAGNAIIRLTGRLRPPPVTTTVAVFLLGAACVTIIAQAHDRLWNRDIAALSPVPLAAQRLDTDLRASLGAPDIGSLIVISADDEQAVLRTAEEVGRRLDPLVADGVMAGYDSPARYLPSERTQALRRDSLPDAASLHQRLLQVGERLELQPGALDVFERQLAAARTAPPIDRRTIEGTSFALGLGGLLWQHDRSWYGMLPLRSILDGPHGGDVDLSRVRAALGAQSATGLQTTGVGMLVLNIKQETDSLYAGYLAAALKLSALGLAAIVALLLIALRNLTRVARVMLPLLLAVLCVVATLTIARVQLTILHLIGMLLIVAVGSNYALFFDRRASDPDHAALPLTLVSLLLANLCTVIGFGVLASSRVPVLQALGVTVAPGTLLVLGFSALLAPARLWR